MAPSETCDQCAGGFFAGVICAADNITKAVTDIERCDACQRFEGDLEAAEYVAAVIGGRVHYEHHPENPEWINEGTDPWVVVGETGAVVVHEPELVDA